MPYKDPIVRREYFQKYRQENKEYYQEYNKKYYQENKEHFQEYEKDYCKEKPWVRMTTRAKKRKNLPFNITAEYVKSIWPEDNKCPALGIEFKQGVGKSIDSSPTLDRIDNSKGYIKGNVQIVCNLANKIMSSATPEQVIQVGKHFKKVMEKKNAA
tara:strand:+ start:270 stop:737 length:468 start_codon:yes stop_codon:yes gene_type:complete